ncbi:hypothetical protein AU074_13980 [Pseudomonas sp. ATCC PTA-122608]|uniref:hypothetical protein n=1 Tax=Pseudomonas sp. ATCC PTA-122608 TaxID=1771311 RepID=UPI00096B69C0|nr:hypothetical protein [Pseudomonas sp. ATCC PTA-122608]OLY72280.1 hypothetical protein AU074_13980 [Pseudomonas sp. ATCC PTA-122608]
MNCIKIKMDLSTQTALADLAKESQNAYVLLMYICMNSEAAKRTDVKITQFITYVTAVEMAEYIGKSEETVRRALVILKKRNLINCDIHVKGTEISPLVYIVEAKINRY